MRAVRIALAAICALYLSAAAAFALDPAIFGQNERTLQQLRTSLAETSQKLLNPVLTDQELADFKATLEQVRTSAAEQSASLLQPLSEVNKQLLSLGPAPTDGHTEDPAVAQARSDLTTSRDKLQSLKSQYDVVGVEAEQASGRVSDLQREQFFERVFVRTHSIFNPTLWYDTWAGLGALFTGLKLLFSTWWADASANGNPYGLLLIPALLLILATVYRIVDQWTRRLLAHYVSTTPRIDDMARIWLIVRSLIVTIAGLFVIIFPIHLTLDAAGYLTPRMMMLWSALVTTIAVTLIYHVMVRGLAAPRFSELRILDLDNTAAARLSSLVTIIAFVAISNTQVGLISEGLYLGINYTIGQSAAAALVLLILMGVTIYVLRNQPGLQDPSGRRIYFSWAGLFTPLAWALVAAGLAALSLGYISLADYIAHQMVRTAMALTFLFLLYYLADAAVGASFDPQSTIGSFIRHTTGLGERAIERIGLLVRTAVDLIFIIAGVPLLVIIWTLTWVDFRGLLNTLALGVQVGNLRISPGIALSALAILIGGIIATKLFNTWLDRRILSHTRIDKGVQDSILKGSSYAGVILAVGLALTAGGLDFSNLAIMAGALGVGIGFGLQAIVNNFVSGLIILAERPIRVGDWVALPEGEGVVRRINVRSTEIETFDACTIIIPNLSLVTAPVRNWTHSDNMGRVIISLTVESSSDADLVRKVLIEVARSHPKVLTTPTPTVLLTQLGLNGLEFDLRAFVADIMEGSLVASDLRFKILDAFAENGVNISQPIRLMQVPKS